MKTNPIGLYIHIPFCKKKCAYCDFCSYEGISDDIVFSYIKRLCQEIEEYKSATKVPVDSIFFGGGTPSLIPQEYIEMILKTARSIFAISNNTEITIEINPGVADREKLSAYFSYGINRLSIGLQSIHENELKYLGRIHTFSDFLEVYELAREIGFKNTSIDLMYGIPGQTLNSFCDTLNSVLSLSPEHLSVYSLILEEGTPLAATCTSMEIPNDDTVSDMYDMCNALLSKHGYSHYEISNYAKAGYECKHNLKYWNNTDFIGVGLSAFSYLNHNRYGNFGTMNDLGCLSEYISSATIQKCYNELTDKKTEMSDYIMLALRTKYGVNYKVFAQRFGESFKQGREYFIDKYTKQGLAVDNGYHFYLTDKGMFLSNTIIADLI